MPHHKRDLLTLITYDTIAVDEAAARALSTDADCAPCSAAATATGFADGALLAQVNSLIAAGGPAAQWSGPIGYENRPTGDGRMIETNALAWEVPVPLLWAPENNGGHLGAQVVGWITEITRGENGAIVGSGAFDLGSEIGREAYRQVQEGLTPGISMDLDDVSFEIRVKAELLEPEPSAMVEPEGFDPETGEPIWPERSENSADESGYITVARMSSDDEMMVTTSARIRAATLVATPAFAEALVTLIDGDALADELLPALVASATTVTERTAPPRSAFNAPDLDGPTPLTVSDTGRVFGHIATWDTCHIGYPGQCVTPPPSPSGYAFFHTGAIVADNGQEIAVGHLTIDTGHAEANLRSPEALAHYDNSGTAVAYVRAGEDAYGIWVAGVVRPDATPEQVRALRASPISGDWRRIGAGMELVAALGVNVPGFPVPRTRALVAGGAMQSLVAAGMLAPREVVRPGLPGALSMDDLRYLKHLANAERERQRRAAPAAPEALAQVEEMAKRVKVMAFAAGLDTL